MPEITVVLPAYNEEKNIAEAVNRVEKYLIKRFKTYEIVVVDDGSRDKTAEMVKRMARKKSGIKLVSHPKNLGYGRALRSGFAKARGKLVFYTDSDNQYDINELDYLLPYLQKHDIVAGYRIHHSDPLTRVVISWAYNMLIRLLLGLKVKDVDCSFKLYKRVVFDKITLRCNTGLVDAEVLIKALKKGFTIHQLGVNHYPRMAGKSIYEIGGRNQIFAMVSPRVPLAIFKEMARYWKELT